MVTQDILVGAVPYLPYVSSCIFDLPLSEKCVHHGGVNVDFVHFALLLLGYRNITYVRFPSEQKMITTLGIPFLAYGQYSDTLKHF